MRKSFKSLLPALALMVLALPASAAEKGLAVAELFTTQGCSFCPPADEILEKLVLENDPKVLALSCHVTYFDRPEWKDTMSGQFCDERHYGYRTALDVNGVYTPQIIINGRFDSKGNKEELVRSGIKLGQSMGTVSRLPLTLIDGVLDINLPGMRLEQPAEVWLLPYTNSKNMMITGGQNKGRVVNYVHVVNKIKKIMDWNGGLRSMAFPVADFPADGYAVIVQYAGHGEVITAGQVDKSLPQSR